MTRSRVTGKNFGHQGSWDFHHRGVSKFACFHCRRSFARSRSVHEFTQCPFCHGKLYHMGNVFKPPTQTDDRTWHAVQLLREAGVLYTVFHDDPNWAMPTDLNPKREDDRSHVWHILKVYNGFWEYTPQKPVWKVPPYQWWKPRPTHPRDVPPYLDWWYENIRRRISVVMEMVDFLGFPKPQMEFSEEARGRFKSSL